ncbi:MAG: HypC/HybG/HupF family hydrogenase formation chaperone [Gemmatimonadales bacterium]|nr:HypC/HybG/HupF family hydrogenase formation chaperone [Gemmatimonadales bacterium]
MTAPRCGDTADGQCALCRDEAVAARVVTIDSGGGTAEVVIEGQVAIIALDLVEAVGTGDTVLVHQGFAIQRVERS